MISTVYDKEKYEILANKLSKTKTFKFIFVCGIIILLSGLLYLGVTIFDKESDFSDYIFAVVDILLGVFFMCYKFMFKKILTRQKNLGRKEEYTFEEDCLGIKSYDKFGNELLQTKLKYTNLSNIEIFDGYIFLFLNKISAIMINEEEFRKLENSNNILINMKQGIETAKQNSMAK